MALSRMLTRLPVIVSWADVVPHRISHGGLGGPAVGQELAHDLGEGLDPHQNDQRVHRSRELGPVDGRGILAGLLVAGDHREGGGELPVGERNAGVGRDRDG